MSSSVEPISPSRLPAGVSRLGRIIYPLAVALVLGAWLAAAFTHLDFWAFEDDEGTFLLTARSLWDGHVLYRDVWLNYFAGLMSLLQFTFRLGGVAVTAPRIAMALLAAATMLGAGAIARRLAGRLAGVFAVLLLALTPAISQMGRSAMAEVPAAACGVLAVFALQAHLRDGRPRWLPLAGLAAGLGIWFKYPTALLLAPLLVGLWASRRQGQPRRGTLALRTALLLGCALIPLAIDALIYDPALQWGQIIGTYLENGADQELNIPRNLDKFVDYFQLNNWGLAALSAVGLPLVARRHRAEVWLLGSWVGCYVAGMLINRPLGSHHLYLLLPPLGALAAVALARLAAVIRQGRQHPLRRSALLELAIITAAALLLVVRLPASVASTIALYRSEAEQNAELSQVSALVAAETLPGDLVVSDLAMIAFRAGRSAPPGLTNTSSMRFNTGRLSEEAVRAEVEALRPAAIVFWEDKFTERAPGFVADIQSRYVELYRNDERESADELRLHAVYLRPDRAR